MKNRLFGPRSQSNSKRKPRKPFDESVLDEGDTPENLAGRNRSPQEREFLLRLQSGDPEAWEQLMDEWSTKLYNYMLYNTRTEEDAKDVLSDTLLGVVQSIKNFDGNANLSTFIYSIAYRKVADYWRRSKQTVELPVWLSTAGPSSLSIELQEALAELPEQAQHALLLRYYAGLSVAEIAEVLGRSYKATESLLSRVRQQFHHAFIGAEA
ncbi:MAG: RNA polymerase sigma factor [Caldilineaceae bacterium]|nr:RNA polymerase sigma factor [Caldilineaceae bacterium]MCB0126947.1 RNA polymerase sigma factor [Caldilineaceae bacterium]